VVRSVLVTALNLDIGRHIWWPNRLSRVPDVPPERAAEEMRAPRPEPSPAAEID
jgi:RND superfamily putative drug exporter